MSGKFAFSSKIDVKKWATTMKAEQIKKLERAMESAKLEIIDRTLAGKQIDGKQFKKYSKAYAQFKQRHGRKTNVDLTYTGRMLAAINHTVEDHGLFLLGIIDFKANEQGQKARWNQETRPFFGLSKSQQEAIKNKLK